MLSFYKFKLSLEVFQLRIVCNGFVFGLFWNNNLELNSAYCSRILYIQLTEIGLFAEVNTRPTHKLMHIQYVIKCNNDLPSQSQIERSCAHWHLVLNKTYRPIYLKMSPLNQLKCLVPCWQISKILFFYMRSSRSSREIFEDFCALPP